MGPDIDIKIGKDDATPAVEQLGKLLTSREVKRAVGTACVKHIQDHFRALPDNKRGWPSSGFWDGAARGTTWDYSPDGIVIQADNEERPGALRFQYHGGTVTAGKNTSCVGGGPTKNLAIPARQEFYGHSPCAFTNLRFVMFASGAKALVIGEAGVGQIDFKTGRERQVKGAGVRSQAMVAYWLVPEATIPPYKNMIPTSEELSETAIKAVADLLEEKGGVK